MKRSSWLLATPGSPIKPATGHEKIGVGGCNARGGSTYVEIASNVHAVLHISADPPTNCSARHV